MVDQDTILLDFFRRAKTGDQKSFDSIIKILEPELKKIAKKFYIVGSDDQDVLQECRIGVWKAIKDFDEKGGMSPKNFTLNLCVKRHLITAMSHANTQKFRLQNEAVSLSAPVKSGEDDIQTYADYIPDSHHNLEDEYIIQEEFYCNLELVKQKFTKLEFSILGQFAYNSSYKEIAEALNIKTKSVDNTLLRVRKKSSEVYQHYITHHNHIGISSIMHGMTTNFEFEIHNDLIGFSTCIYT